MRSKAFTMVELLAAIVLSTLLFVTAILIIRSFSKLHPTNQESSQGWGLAARQQLTWDFNNATVFRQDDRGVILGGYGSLNPKTFASEHAPVLVTYSLRDINSRRWLVREQTSLDPLAANLNFTELLCGDVKSFAITGSYAPREISADTATAAAQDPTPVIFQQISDSQRVPDRLRVKIDLQNDPVPVMNTVLYLR